MKPMVISDKVIKSPITGESVRFITLLVSHDNQINMNVMLELADGWEGNIESVMNSILLELTQSRRS